MYVVGLTGGIGSGKSTVSALLAERGAVVIDADAIAREVVEPGTPGFDQVVAAFGRDVLGSDGRIDRPALGRIVFADPDKRRVLEGIVWPKVGETVAGRLAELATTDSIVILDVPLLVESEASRRRAQAVIVVATSPETQLRRLQDRGTDPDDARARIAAQAPLADKLAVADHVIWNDGSMAELEARVDEVWAELLQHA